MTTEKQIRANRINALKGGVKTPEGKAISSRNAVTHGFFSEAVILPGEDRRLMEQFREKLMAEVQPQSELETILAERIISSAWRLKRILLADQRHPRNDAFLTCESARDRLRYETTLERQIFKALRELEKLQKARGIPQPPGELAEDIAGDTGCPDSGSDRQPEM